MKIHSLFMHLHICVQSSCEMPVVALYAWSLVRLGGGERGETKLSAFI